MEKNGTKHDLKKNREHYANRRFTDLEIQNLLNFFALNPGSTNEQAAAYLDHKVQPRTISHYLKRANFSCKEFTGEQETYVTDESKQVVRTYCAFIRTIDTNRRIYMTKVFFTTMKLLDLAKVLKEVSFLESVVGIENDRLFIWPLEKTVLFVLPF